jgi:hypothetical protein
LPDVQAVRESLVQPRTGEVEDSISTVEQRTMLLATDPGEDWPVYGGAE